MLGLKHRCQVHTFQVPGAQVSGSRYQVHMFQVPGAQVSGSRYQVCRFQVSGARYQVHRFQVSGANFKIPEICKILKLPELILNNPLTNVYVGNLQYPSLQLGIFGFQTILLEKLSYSVNHGGPNVFANWFLQA